MAVSPKSRRSKATPAIDTRPASSPTKVLTLSAAGEMGGAERSLLEVARAISPSLIQLQAVAPPESPLSKSLRDAGIRVHDIELGRIRKTLNPLKIASQLQGLRQGAKVIAEICRQEKIEVIHANTTAAALMAWELSRVTKISFVWHCRDIRNLHGLAGLFSAKAAAVVAISAAVQDYLMKQGVKKKKISKIENGIELTRFANVAGSRAAIRKSLGIAEAQPVLLTIGGYVPWKRHEYFLETLARVHKELPDVVGLIAGSDVFSQNAAYSEKLKARARALSLSEKHLRWLGEREDVPQLLGASDVMISCSENEPFGRVVAEAGAAGIPVVSTDSGGKPEIIEDGVTGILTPLRDTKRLADACIKLLKDDGLRNKMGAAARNRIELLFDVRRTANELSSLLEGVAVHGP